MNDLIDRQKAIEAMSNVNDSICGQQAIDELLELPSENEWIPVSERLPETSGEVLVTRRFGLYVGDDYDRCIDIGYYYSNLNQWDTLDLDDIEVLAWMLLPKPYEGGDE